MEPRHVATTIWVVVALASLLAMVGLLAGLDQLVPLGGLAVVLAVTQRSRLARSLTTDQPDRRRHRFRIAGVSTVVAVTAIAGYLWDIGDDDISDLALLAFNLVGGTAMLAAVVFAVAGLLTRPATTG